MTTSEYTEGMQRTTMDTHDRSPQTLVIAQQPTQWMTLPEICRHIRRSRKRLYELMKMGLPSHQPDGPRTSRLFDPLEVDAWIRNRCDSPAPAPDDEQVA